MKKVNRKKIDKKISCLGPVTEYIHSLEVDDLETAAFVSSGLLEKYLCKQCRKRYGFPRINFMISESEDMHYLEGIFCGVKCFVKWVAENTEKLEEDMDSLCGIIDDKKENDN